MDGMMGDLGMGNSTPEMNMSGDIDYNFNIKDGIFESMQETLVNKMSTMGINLEVESKLKMDIIE